jgi:hypothetical protein
MDLARSHFLKFSCLHPCHILDFRQGRARDLSCRRTSLIQSLPVPESQPFPSFALLRSRLPSHSNKVGTAIVLSFSPPPIQGLPDPMLAPPIPFLSPSDPEFQGCHTPKFLPMPFPHYSTPHVLPMPFHIMPPRFMLTSRTVTQISLSLKIDQSLKCLSSIAYLDLAVAPRLSSLRKIRTQDCVLRIQ